MQTRAAQGDRKMRVLVLLLALAAPLPLAAEESVRLDAAPIDPRDVASLQAGARTFVNYCLNCHSAGLMRYHKLLDLGLTEQQVKDNLLFTADKIGELMSVAMTKKDAKEWFGTAPPDLSVVARSRGADWLYSYLRGFYRDDKRPTGWNNTVYPDVAMPHVLWTLQGERGKQAEEAKGGAAEEHSHAPKAVKLEQLSPGTLSPLEYDTAVRDLVNYLVWMGEPDQLLRKQTGFWVLLVLSIMLLLT